MGWFTVGGWDTPGPWSIFREAKDNAQARADRDGIAWHVWKSDRGRVEYFLSSEHENTRYLSVVFTAQPRS